MERKYKSIFEYIDFGDHKKALQETEKALKKLESKKADKTEIGFVKGLKCLALNRLGKQTDASDLLTALLHEKPVDVEVLQVLQSACKELRRYDDLTILFDNAAKTNPCEEVLASLFMSYVIKNDFKRQQQVATKLHQMVPDKRLYFFWSVMSTVLQATEEPKLADTLYLPLAEKLCSKYLKETGIDSPNELILYLDILKRMKNYEKAVQFLLQDNRAKLLDDMDYRLTRLAEFQFLKGSWTEASDCYEQLLQNHPDQWLFWERLVDCGLQLLSQGHSSKISAIESLIEVSNSKHSRSALLAALQMKLLATKRKITLNDNKFTAKEVFQSYIMNHSGRPNAFEDIKSYVELLDHDELSKMVSCLTSNHAYFKEQDDGKVSNQGTNIFKELEEIVLVERLRAVKLESAPMITDRLESLKGVLRKYDIICSSNCGSAMHDTEYRPGDRIIVLIASNLLKLYKMTGETKYLFEAGNLLTGLPSSNYHKNLLNLLIFNVLGAGAHVFYSFMKLEIKHIQFETLGYLSLATLSQCGDFSHYLSILELCQRHTAMTAVDFANVVPNAYTYGTFAKIPEMIDLQRQLRMSVDGYLVTIEKALFDLHMSPPDVLANVAADILEKFTSHTVKWSELLMNRDYKCLSTCFLNVPSDEDILVISALQKSIAHLCELEVRLIATSVVRPNMKDINALAIELLAAANDVLFVSKERKEIFDNLWPISPIFTGWPIFDDASFIIRYELLANISRLAAKIVDFFNSHETGEVPMVQTSTPEWEILQNTFASVRDLTSNLKSELHLADNQSSTLKMLCGITKTLGECFACIYVPVERMRFVKAQLAKLAKKKKEGSMGLTVPFFDEYNGLAKAFEDTIKYLKDFALSLHMKFDNLARADEGKNLEGRVYGNYANQLNQISERLSRMSLSQISV